MLYITIPANEIYDSDKNEFIDIKETKLVLEHSLVSLSKWESKWCKPFLNNEEKTGEQVLDYIKCMTITQNVSPETYLGLTEENLKAVEEYIARPMTATWFSNNRPPRGGREVLTAEVIYYAMIANNIPFECQKWHLNKLLTLIRVCNEKNSPPKKMSRNELLARNRELNAQRLKRMNTHG